MIEPITDYTFYFFDGCGLMSDIKTNVYTYAKSWRRTGMGAITQYIAICLTCKSIVKPARVEKSKGGTHGTNYFVHEHPLVFILLEQSNSGKRYILVPDELRNIKEELERMWIYEDGTIGDVIKLISLYLSLSK